MGQRRLGIDFGSAGVKITEASMDKGVPVVHWQHVVPVKALAVASGIVSPDHLDRVANDIKQALRENKITTRDAVGGINAAGNIFTRRTVIEHHDPKDIRSHLSHMIRADRALLGDVLEDVEIDLVVLEELQKGEERKLDVFLCAVRTAQLETINQVLTKAGLRMVGADVNILATLRALRIFPRGMGQLDVLVDVGADVTSILIHENGRPVHLGLHTGIGGRDADRRITETMQEDDPTTVLKNKVSANRTYEADNGLENYYRGLRSQIVQEMDSYLRGRRTSDGISGVTLVGGTARTPGLVESLSRQIDNIPVVIGQLDPSITGEPQQYAEQGLLSIDYTASIGLALGAGI